MLVEKDLFRLFPSLVFKGKIEDDQIVDRALDSVLRLQDIGYGTKTPNKFSTNDNLQTLPEFHDLCQIIHRESSSILDFFSVKRQGHEITSMWSHITGANHRHIAHTHPNNYLSGVIYLQTPENCGNTIFLDPRAGSRAIHPDYEEPNYFNMDSFIHKPQKGNMLIWQSWLPHMVDYDSETTDSQRVIISFNIMFKGPVERSSEKMFF
jgi:uncharacterized protein (TIGR02466 family)